MATPCKTAILVSLFLVAAGTPSHTVAGTVDTAFIHSVALQRTVQYFVFLPAHYHARSKVRERYPVVYLLHCAGGEAADWLDEEGPAVQDAMNHVNLIVVAPDDGSGYSWWTDSPVDSKSKASIFLSAELKSRIDSSYATLPHRAHTGLAGFSMGGYGAFHNLLQHPQIFGAAFGICSALDLMRWTGAWGLNQVFGDPQKHLTHWQEADIIDNIAEFKGIQANIRFYSTSEDFFLEENRLFHTLLAKHNIKHRYDEYHDSHSYPSASRMIEILRHFESVMKGD